MERRLEPPLELLLLELLPLDEPFEELPLDDPLERETPEEELPELDERREELVELPLDEPREELEEPESLGRRDTLLLSERSRLEERRSEEVEGWLDCVGVSLDRAGRATELPPRSGKLTFSSARESVAPRRETRRLSGVEALPAGRLSRTDSVSVR
ncbi:hypothetical protein HUU05_19010, partial [candidate division KSB1 bacterium]|nr:hypothetical protein [candidate division KSB1 bacterium]